jgi:hypothetical protein
VILHRCPDVAPPAIALCALITAPGAASADSTDAVVKVGAHGDWEVCKDLSVTVEVYNWSGHGLVVRGEWNGRHDAPGSKEFGNHAN